MAAKMTNEQHREAGKSHLKYFREVLRRDGDDAKLELHANHIRSLLAFASPDKR
ncbi:hypothetical protein QCM77_25075 [Bradyrhizobium sp. SSUT18]|uniref:hypothetical protein n=1 Tax=unclassified Bradyrhizobium TaxID=2631580 RepID=UPI002447C2A0|nr:MULTISPECIES: hypothetical protein [unclassified Bradyrhizobium]MDH2354487.1 hypothetical protein [Bradyrhizobium sp. SSUT112]MDH2403195.1 hypothetical protein [Bradyrhizobium sp. SSUT18]